VHREITFVTTSIAEESIGRLVTTPQRGVAVDHGVFVHFGPVDLPPTPNAGLLETSELRSDGA
jgi:hypothetical protein